MSCGVVRRRLSRWLDGELEAGAARRLEAHLAACAACARRARELRAVSRLVSELPALSAAESLAASVVDRLDMARRPALGFLFRGFSATRPFILPSLVPATLVVVTVLAGVLLFDSGPLPEVHLAPGGAWGATPALGTEGNPVFPSAGIDLPRETTSVPLPTEALSGDESVFLEQLVARDGSVADVTLLEGDATGTASLMNALRQQRFEPVRYRGRPVAVSVYRLISRMEVRSPLT
ncbi:MAG TPA: zf-HC2 domain-containing protein [Vicinamibacteria bacterium]|nr:zf-HC2 domain-containing protein [Vicinamibacteria bacterium]